MGRSVTDKIRSLHLYGFGGECGAAAVTINRKVFRDKGIYVAAFNKWWFENETRAIGHVAVKYKGKYYDANGLLTEEDLLSWGMLDEEDPDYHNPAMSVQDYYEAELYELTEEEALELFDRC